MGYVYILSNEYRNVLYIGVTNNLQRRYQEHLSGAVDGFTKKYHVHCLLYYEQYNHIEEAIEREKQLKRWSRSKKEWLIKQMNPEMVDLAEAPPSFRGKSRNLLLAMITTAFPREISRLSVSLE